MSRTDLPLLTESQLSSFADMDVVNNYADVMQYAYDNLAADTAMIRSAGTESRLLYRSNEWLEAQKLEQWEELPSFLYIGDYTQTPGITSAEIDILDDIDAIIVAHYNDTNGFYDEFKYYIENVDIESLSSGIQERMATTLYVLDITFHSTEILAFGWGGFHPTAAQNRCLLATVSGGGLGFLLSGMNPFVGILSGMASYAATDACW